MVFISALQMEASGNAGREHRKTIMLPLSLKRMVQHGLLMCPFLQMMISCLSRKTQNANQKQIIPLRDIKEIITMKAES